MELSLLVMMQNHSDTVLLLQERSLYLRMIKTLKVI